MRRMLVGLLLAAATLLTTAGQAAADCAYPLAIPAALTNAGSDPVFVGTVVESTNRGKWVTFVVEEVWQGSVDGKEVEVHAGPPPKGDVEYASATRFYELGARYLVFTQPYLWTSFGDDPDSVSDNACSTTQLWTDGLAQYRPTDATFIEHDQPILPRTNDSSPPYVMIALTTVLVAGGCLYLLLRRGSLAYRARQDEMPASKS